MGADVVTVLDKLKDNFLVEFGRTHFLNTSLGVEAFGFRDRYTSLYNSPGSLSGLGENNSVYSLMKC